MDVAANAEVREYQLITAALLSKQSLWVRHTWVVAKKTHHLQSVAIPIFIMLNYLDLSCR